jgi:uncharacterized protein (DUF1697 family)
MPARKGGGRTASGSYVALLRGINVGGNNPLPMKDLAILFTKAGCAEVKTYIQSGNVVFHADAKTAARIATATTKAIADRTGMRIPVVVRTAAELGDITRGNPFLQKGADPDKLHVVFLAEAPSAAKIAGLDPKRSSTDEFAVRGAEIYLHCPNGYGRTQLSNAYFDAKLGTIGTVRNWRTVLKLTELAGG